jgi:hypothetical protein
MLSRVNVTPEVRAGMNDNADIPKAALAWLKTGSGLFAPPRDQREFETVSSAFHTSRDRHFGASDDGRE